MGDLHEYTNSLSSTATCRMMVSESLLAVQDSGSFYPSHNSVFAPCVSFVCVPVTGVRDCDSINMRESLSCSIDFTILTSE